MKKQERSTLTIVMKGLCAVLLIGMAACADRNNSETEGTEMAVSEDTTARANYYFSEWDSDGDGYLDPDEYSGGFFTAWDANGDRQLDENEWLTGYERMGQSGLSWADWDLNTDGFLSEGEYRQGYDNAGWYKAWDSDNDNRLSEQEYNEGMARQNNPNQ